MCSVNSPCDLFEGEGTGGLASSVCEQGAGVEDKDRDSWTVCCDGQDPFVSHVEAVAHIELFENFRAHPLRQGHQSTCGHLNTDENL